MVRRGPFLRLGDLSPLPKPLPCDCSQSPHSMSSTFSFQVTPRCPNVPPPSRAFAYVLACRLIWRRRAKRSYTVKLVIACLVSNAGCVIDADVMSVSDASRKRTTAGQRMALPARNRAKRLDLPVYIRGVQSGRSSRTIRIRICSRSAWAKDQLTTGGSSVSPDTVRQGWHRRMVGSRATSVAMEWGEQPVSGNGSRCGRRRAESVLVPPTNVFISCTSQESANGADEIPIIRDTVDIVSSVVPL